MRKQQKKLIPTGGERWIRAQRDGINLNIYETEKATYHVSADLAKVPASKDCDKQQLLDLFEQNDTRQVLHVAFGTILTKKNEDGNYIFRDRIMACLNKNEEVHYELLTKHIKKHINNYNKGSE